MDESLDNFSAAARLIESSINARSSIDLTKNVHRWYPAGDGFSEIEAYGSSHVSDFDERTRSARTLGEKQPGFIHSESHENESFLS
jgi:hypothetical protein